MRISEFISANVEQILKEWEEFAITLVSESQKTDVLMLRDHLAEMLAAVAADLSRAQSDSAGALKSKGMEPRSSVETAAEAHGAARLACGFSMDAAVAEFRALRASITRLWQESTKLSGATAATIDDLIRFNEAIDQAVAESVNSYSLVKDRQARLFDAILSSSPDLVFTLLPNGNLAYANRAMVEFLDRPLPEIIGKSTSDLCLGDTQTLVQEAQQVIAAKKAFRGEMLHTDSNGDRRFYDYILVPVADERGNVEAVACTNRDVTDRKVAGDKSWEDANFDQLTGLPNRRLFLDRLGRDVKHAGRLNGPVALLFIDLDHFKEVNDRLGHAAGDALLKWVADRIRGCIRETDTVARLGGDEFTVILQDIEDPAQVQFVATKILNALTGPFRHVDQTVIISASIGISISPQDASSPEEMIKNSDFAMYEAKKSGRNCVRLFGGD